MQLWFGFASVSFDDPIPLVVNVYFTAGHVIFAEAACLLSLVTLVIWTPCTVLPRPATPSIRYANTLLCLTPFYSPP